MPSLLTRLIHDAQTFLTSLEAENTREWWTAHKEDYEEKLKAPAQTLLAEMSGKLSRLTDAPVGTKLFRPQRDIRFAKDKTPYHTHLHMLWSVPGNGPIKPAYFFGISPNYVTLGAGQRDFDKAGLEAWRHHADIKGHEVAILMNTLTDADFRISDPAYKRVPAPYPKNHPNEAILRRKGLTAWRDSDAGLTRDQMAQVFDALTPLVLLLARL
ncbi:MAG: DUF2461 domain-containing protein [Pseudomonadota bacterium]